MPAERTIMRQVREVLRLKFVGGVPIREIWSQVLLYFDSFIIGLTATPAGKTIGFFNQNLIMQYGHDEAVTDGVNVDFDVYRIRTRVTEQGATIDAGTGVYVDVRHRLTRAERLQWLNHDLTYTSNQLDRDVVSESQIRTVLQQFRDKVLPDAFPGRNEVPKTLIFAKDDSCPFRKSYPDILMMQPLDRLLDRALHEDLRLCIRSRVFGE